MKPQLELFTNPEQTAPTKPTNPKLKPRRPQKIKAEILQTFILHSTDLEV